MRPAGYCAYGALFLLLAATGLGCATAAKDTTGFAIVDTRVVDAPYEEVWESTRDALLATGYSLYIRDKRGMFVAFSDQRRRWVTGTRTQLTVTLESTGADATRVTVETLRQQYGTTLLTYPGWHDRKANSNEVAVAVLDDLEARATGEAPEGVTPEAAVSEADGLENPA